MVVLANIVLVTVPVSLDVMTPDIEPVYPLIARTPLLEMVTLPVPALTPIPSPAMLDVTPAFVSVPPPVTDKPVLTITLPSVEVVAATFGPIDPVYPIDPNDPV